MIVFGSKFSKSFKQSKYVAYEREIARSPKLACSHFDLAAMLAFQRYEFGRYEVYLVEIEFEWNSADKMSCMYCCLLLKVSLGSRIEHWLVQVEGFK